VINAPAGLCNFVSQPIQTIAAIPSGLAATWNQINDPNPLVASRAIGNVVGGVELSLAIGGIQKSLTANAAKSGTPLYRAVTEAELSSIRQTGQLSVVPGSSTPLPGVQGKWFYGSLEDAQAWARQAAAVDGGPLKIIQTTVPKSVAPAYSQPWVDSIRNPALFYDMGSLNAPIKVLPGTIP